MKHSPSYLDIHMTTSLCLKKQPAALKRLTCACLCSGVVLVHFSESVWICSYCLHNLNHFKPEMEYIASSLCPLTSCFSSRLNSGHSVCFNIQTGLHLSKNYWYQLIIWIYNIILICHPTLFQKCHWQQSWRFPSLIEAQLHCNLNELM